MKPGSEERCPDRDPRTGKQCVLSAMSEHGVDGRQHRWWKVRSKERPSWYEGYGRIEWATGERSVPVGGDA